MPPPPPHRRLGMHENVKVPVAKNIIFALKLVWQTDKKLLICSFLNMSADMIFSVFLQNILFLKVLLGIIDSKGDFREFVKNLVLFLVLSVIVKGINWSANYIRQASTKKVLKGLNNKVFKKAIELDVSCYEDPEFYDKYQRATQILAWGLFVSVCDNISSIVAGVISLCLVIGTVTTIDPMYLLFLVPVGLVFIIETFKSKLVYKRDREMTTNNRIKAYVQRTVFLKEFSKDMRTSNIFAVLMERFKAAIDSNMIILKKYGIKLFIYSMISSLFSDFIPTIGTYALAGYQFVYTNKMTVSAFSVVLSSINAVQEATMRVAGSFEMLSQSAFYFQNLRDFFDYEPKIKSGNETCGEFESLEFRNVSFRYPSAKKNSLNNVSFKINKGETVALVGVNGAGKSTIVKLLLRFYDTTEGEILYNGKNIKEYELSSLRNSYGAVFQDYRNFAVSVFENILCHECTEGEKAAAQKALEQSGIWEKISSLPKGGDTVLTKEFEEDGTGLSGGENQKVSVARLFAKDFQFAVLDEPSSALDPIAEYKMYQSLIEVTKGKTVLYISHRLSSAVLSDKIIVIGDGTVLEAGSHKELMENGGEYCRMFTLQASSYNRDKEDGENGKD
ncbi:MAG: ABC transporter ATP-binding protein [Clostridia bacterium]|nr:ABC transporter ATP-binding protein [Clostridia bacterium]